MAPRWQTDNSPLCLWMVCVFAHERPGRKIAIRPFGLAHSGRPLKATSAAIARASRLEM